MTTHHYKAQIDWKGNNGEGTLNYKSYRRDYTIYINGKSTEILGSSDAAFLGNGTRYNPEDLFLASVSSCHMLWYLHLCAINNIVVISYKDTVLGEMDEHKSGNGKFSKITLQPKIYVKHNIMIDKAQALHHKANKMCFIANSLNFKVGHKAEIISKN